jgi:hypothetical protein
VKHANAKLGWHESEKAVPLLFDFDKDGLQHYTSAADKKTRLLIVGASTARGTFASQIATTYFNVLATELEKHGHPVAITVAAAGAWKSSQELAALELHGPKVQPNIIILLNGLNDITIGATADALFGESVPGVGTAHAHDYEKRVARYLANMSTAADMARSLQGELLVVLQPSLAEKQPRSRIEQTLFRLSLAEHASNAALADSYAAVRRGLKALEVTGRIHFLDASRIFNDEKHTVFTDMWHFTDFGHEILGKAIATKLLTLPGHFAR